MRDGLCAEFLKVTEVGAIAAFKFAGMGDEKGADKAAVDSMRFALNSLDIRGTIVIGEGERDNAPMLYVGEEVGRGGEELDIALDPLEGTTTCALHRSGAMSVIAVADSGNLLKAPDVYMDKIAVGPGLPSGVVTLGNDIETNLQNLSEVKGCKLCDLLVVVLKRDRHLSLVSVLRRLGVRVRLIDDGDIGAILAIIEGVGDLYVGIGGAPEGVLAAVALAAVGGQMEGRLIFDSDPLKVYAEKLGISDTGKIYGLRDMVRGEAFFVSTGVTDGDILKGIRREGEHIFAYSIMFQPGHVTRISHTVYGGI